MVEAGLDLDIHQRKKVEAQNESLPSEGTRVSYARE